MIETSGDVIVIASGSSSAADDAVAGIDFNSTPPLAIRNANIELLQKLQNSPSAFARIRNRQAIVW